MTYLSKIRWWLLALLAAAAPFHAFLITWLKSAAGSEQGSWLFIITAWREILAALICLIALIEIIGRGERLKPDLLDWLIIAYAALALLWLPFQLKTPDQWLMGFRFDVMPFVFFAIIRRVRWEKFNALLAVILSAGAVVILFGLAHALILPQDFLARFGYSMNQGLYQPDIAISGCQYLEHTDRVCRAISTFGGPTRYGTYLLLVAGLLLPMLWQKRKTETKVALPRRGIAHSLRSCVAGALLALTLASIVLTFSRSIWIGLAAMAVAGMFLLASHSQKYVKQIKIAGIALAVLALIAASVFSWKFATDTQKNYYQQFFKSIFVRSTSTSEHVELAKIGIKTAISHPLGIGLGTVGPASVRFQKFLTENWYIQIADEMGVIGLALFLAILASISKKLLAGYGGGAREENIDWAEKGLFLSLLGIATAGLFTHSFEETTTVLLLLGLAGILLKTNKSRITS